MSWKTIVLKDQSTSIATLRKEIDYLIADVGTDNGLIFDYEGQRRDPSGVAIEHWGEVSDVNNSVQFAVDQDLGVRYVSVSLSREDLLAQLMNYLSEHLEVYTIEELKHHAREMGTDSQATLFRLALVLGEFDPEVCDLIRSALRSPQVTVRNGAARAAALLRWQDLSQALHEALAQEQDAETARILELAIRACSRDVT